MQKRLVFGPGSTHRSIEGDGRAEDAGVAAFVVHEFAPD
jgi:hypothetical protein